MISYLPATAPILNDPAGTPTMPDGTTSVAGSVRAAAVVVSLTPDGGVGCAVRDGTPVKATALVAVAVADLAKDAAVNVPGPAGGVD